MKKQKYKVLHYKFQAGSGQYFSIKRILEFFNRKFFSGKYKKIMLHKMMNLQDYKN